MKRLCALFVVIALLLVGCGSPVTQLGQGSSPEEAGETAAATKAAPEEETDDETPAEEGGPTDEAAIDENSSYTSKDEVALYLHLYGHLPDNYVTKDEAEDAGWKTEGLDLSEACPGKSIGGDRFGNREGLLPAAPGRTYYECDIDYPGRGSRGPKRLVFSNDGLIFYTEDHYQTFEQLYGGAS